MSLWDAFFVSTQISAVEGFFSAVANGNCLRITRSSSELRANHYQQLPSIYPNSTGSWGKQQNLDLELLRLHVRNNPGLAQMPI